MHSPAEALALSRQWSTIASLGASAVPLLVVDLRGLDRSFRIDDQHIELAERLTSGPWVNVAVVGDDLDPLFAALADSFDVLLGDNTDSEAAVDVTDIDSAIAELASAIEASPQASVALAELLRTSHDLPVSQALHVESLTYAVLQTGEIYQHWLGDRSARPVPPTNDAAVSTTLTGSLLRIILQRPERRNALNIAMRDQLTEALELLDLDGSIDGAVLAGSGSNFCAGGDLDEFGSTPSPATGHQVRQ